MNQLLTSHVIGAIRANWASVLHPTAAVDQWDDALRDHLPGRPIWNLTDGFNYDKSHLYDIVMHRGPLAEPGSRVEEAALLAKLGGHLSGIRLMLSAVAPYFRLEFMLWELSPSGDPVLRNEQAPRFPEIAERVRAFAISHGFSELPEDVLQVIIPDVELDMAGLGQVRIYHCLFSDGYT